MSDKTALWIAGASATLGVLYWLSHSWTVTGVIEVGTPTMTYTSGNGGATAPTGSSQPIP